MEKDDYYSSYGTGRPGQRGSEPRTLDRSYLQCLLSFPQLGHYVSYNILTKPRD